MKNIILFIVTLFATSISYANHGVEYDIRIDGITCPFCVASSEKALKKVDGVHSISTNIETGIMTVCTDPTLVLKDEQLKALFLKKGFTYRSISKIGSCTTGDSPTHDLDVASQESSNQIEHDNGHHSDEKASED